MKTFVPVVAAILAISLSPHASASQFGVIGDSLSTAANTDDDCTEILDCISRIGTDPMYSFAIGDESWSLANRLMRVDPDLTGAVSKAANGSRWDDALGQAQALLGDHPGVGIVHIELGGNDICADTAPTINELNGHITNTLNFLNDAPSVKTVIVSEVPDVVQTWEYNAARPNFLFTTFQDFWDLDVNEMKVGGQEALTLLGLIEEFNELVGEGSLFCGAILSSGSTTLERDARRSLNQQLNELIAERVNFFNTTGNKRFLLASGPAQAQLSEGWLSELDGFHFGKNGQEMFADLLWSSIEPQLVTTTTTTVTTTTTTSTLASSTTTSTTTTSTDLSTTTTVPGDVTPPAVLPQPDIALTVDGNSATTVVRGTPVHLSIANIDAFAPDAVVSWGGVATGLPGVTQVMLDTAPLSLGLHTVTATINPTGTLTFNLIAPESVPALGSGAGDDADGDGRSDADEGIGDDDGDGVLNYLDNDGDGANELPVDGRDVTGGTVTVINGRLALGRSALAAGGSGAGVGADRILDSGGGPATVDGDVQESCIGGCFDFVVTGLPPGDVAYVFLPLSVPVPDNAVYRKFIDDAWVTLVTTTAGDGVASASSSGGTCPGPDSGVYSRGLTPGHDCLKLTIVDGGAFDADHLADGTVTDPGGVAVVSAAVPDSDDDDDDFFGCTASPAGMDARRAMDWFLLGGFLVWLGWRRHA